MPVTHSVKGHGVLAIMGSDKWWLVLSKVMVVHGIHTDFSSYKATGKYVLVFFSAQNLGKKPASLLADANFSLLDSQGRTFGDDGQAQTAAATQYSVNDTLTQVQPTYTTHTVDVFDVPSDAHGFKMQTGDILGNNTQTLFSLGI